jgi:hypothetical protein
VRGRTSARGGALCGLTGLYTSWIPQLRATDLPGAGAAGEDTTAALPALLEDVLAKHDRLLASGAAAATRRA